MIAPGGLLILNAGSSTLKFSMFGMSVSGELAPVAHGTIEELREVPRVTVRDAQGTTCASEELVGRDFAGQLAWLMDYVASAFAAYPLRAVGHRVVHGGAAHAGPVLVDAKVLADLEAYVPLAPLHQPHNLAPIADLLRSRPDLPQVVCFDTAFHHDLPAVATRIALPEQYRAAGIRRYGFHGLSYEYVAGRLRREWPALAAGRVIAAHLGNGASLCAMREGRSVDTTMGFTALDGLVMGTRCGSIDPGVVLHLQEACGLDVAAVAHLLYTQSGLLGLSGLSSDMRTLLASADAAARTAIDSFVYRVVREVGALVSVLGGLDALVFTAGIGAHAPAIRARICEALAWLDIALDPLANENNAGAISTARSRPVLVVETDEERMIAEHTLAVIASRRISSAA